MKRSAPLQRRTPMKQKSNSETAEIKERIQALLRAAVIQRDGGCIFRHYPEAGACGSYRKDGVLILQADHLNTRARNISYGDVRLAGVRMPASPHLLEAAISRSIHAHRARAHRTGALSTPRSCHRQSNAKFL